MTAGRQRMRQQGRAWDGGNAMCLLGCDRRARERGNERLCEQLRHTQSSRAVRGDARTQEAVRTNRSEKLRSRAAPKGTGEALQI